MSAVYSPSSAFTEAGPGPVSTKKASKRVDSLCAAVTGLEKVYVPGACVVRVKRRRVWVRV